MEEPFATIDTQGGSISYRPAGTFNETDRNTGALTGRVVEYDEAIVVTWRNKIYKIHPVAAKNLYQAIRDKKDLASFVGVDKGFLG